MCVCVGNACVDLSWKAGNSGAEEWHHKQKANKALTWAINHQHLR